MSRDDIAARAIDQSRELTKHLWKLYHSIGEGSDSQIEYAEVRHWLAQIEERLKELEKQ